MERDRIVRPSPYAYWVTDGDVATAVLHVKRGTWTFLNRLPSMLWALIQDGATLECAYGKIAEYYHVSPERVEAKLTDTIAIWVDAQLVVVGKEWNCDRVHG